MGREGRMRGMQRVVKDHRGNDLQKMMKNAGEAKDPVALVLVIIVNEQLSKYKNVKLRVNWLILSIPFLFIYSLQILHNNSLFIQQLPRKRSPLFSQMQRRRMIQQPRNPPQQHR